MTADSYVVYGAVTPVDEDEVREAVEKLLLGERAPPALLKVVGRNAYDRWAARQACGVMGPADGRHVRVRVGVHVHVHVHVCVQVHVMPGAGRS